MVNGSPTKPFHMERGLRQGDLLSPFLFILVAEILNRLISKAKKKELIQGLQIRREAVNIFHQQFANDTILLYPATYETMVNYGIF